MTKSTASLKTVVGDKVYSVWLDMLRVLVPSGRTHRLAVVVAGMLQYATVLAANHKDVDEEESVAWNLVVATETPDPEEAEEFLMHLVQKLFRDAQVSPDRISSKGISYSIAEDAIQEFVGWENMPWE
ncbi:hypothetical protein [Desulfonatronum thioautotrophicum]|uniref:hypothetical protein n=1 Tax=Desulfonatronum thioautotrophicum TaxID=617001 RepID=UPI0005EACD68|nr:hypothetical protein [Desulfonatronum thioautotrophicum]